MAKSKGAITEVYTLPSKGLLYGDSFGSEVTIRSMTTFEEKMRLGNQGFFKTMCSILDSVVISPESYETQYMTLFDFYFLMYKMRTVSYGPTYKVNVTCPVCGHQEIVKVNLDDLEVKYLDDSVVEPIKVGPLPRSGDTLGCRFLRVIDTINNEKKAKEILNKSPNYVGDPQYILNRVSQIVSINGEEKTPAEIQMYVEEMQAMDSAYYTQAYEKATEDVGLLTMCDGVCSSCGEELRFSLPFNSEFFRPTFDL